MASLGEQVVLPALREVRAAAEELKGKTAAHLAAGGISSAEHEAARTAWKKVMTAVQRAEVMQVGPAATSMRTGGLALRDELYSWPDAVNPCRVDQELVANQFRTPGFFGTVLVSAYGLDALEYLLFVDGPNNTCPSQATINTQGSWATIGATELARRRADYADAVAERVATDAARLVEAWEPSGGDFLGELQRAGQAGASFSSAQMAVDDFFAAMLYLDLFAKDRKLAEPAGISPLCGAPFCPQKAESRFARHSKENLHANLSGFQALLLGNAPDEPERVGFDDFLTARGAPELATQLAEETTSALLAVDALAPSLEEALVSDLPLVQTAHTAVKRLTDLLKSQFVTVLNLQVPDEGASDND